MYIKVLLILLENCKEYINVNDVKNSYVTNAEKTDKKSSIKMENGPKMSTESVHNVKKILLKYIKQ